MDTSLVLDIFRFLAGLMLCFYGATTLRRLPQWSGALLGGVLALESFIWLGSIPRGWEIGLPVGAFLAGMLIGYLLGRLIWVSLVLLCCAVAGGILGFGVGFFLNYGGGSSGFLQAMFAQSPLDGTYIFYTLAGAIVFLVVSVLFHDLIFMFSTSILGALLVLAGVVKLAGGSIPFLLIDTIVVFVWAALSLFGLIWQNQSK